MLVVMEHGATDVQIARVVEVIKAMGYQPRPMPGAQRTTVGLVGNDGRVDGSQLEALDGVAEVIHVSKPYKQVSREWRPENTLVTIAPGVTFGGPAIPKWGVAVLDRRRHGLARNGGAGLRAFRLLQARQHPRGGPRTVTLRYGAALALIRRRQCVDAIGRRSVGRLACRVSLRLAEHFGEGWFPGQ